MPTQTRKWLRRLALAALVIGFPAVHAQEPNTEGWEKFADASPYPTNLITVPSWRFARGPHVRAAFRDIVVDPTHATVLIRSDGEKAAFGAIIRSNGWIVTKASQLSGDITCQLADGRPFEAQIGAINRENDIALLKIDATNLPILHFANVHAPPLGAWLASVGIDRDPLAVGVMSVEPREIAHRRGILGIQLADRTNQAVVVRVFPESAAQRAGMLQHDLILSINAQPTPTREQLIRRVGEYSPGDKVEVEVRRNEETLTLKATLGGDFPGPPSREEFQNQLGGDLSRRRFGFADAFQHDTVLKPTHCGGPVVNLKGEVVGLNIARAGRTETYALTANTLAVLIEELLTENPADILPRLPIGTTLPSP